jgi:hypothetical protein
LLKDETRKKISAALRKGQLNDADALITSEAARYPESEEIKYFQSLILLAKGEAEEGLGSLLDSLRLAEERSNLRIAIAASARLSSMSPDNIDLRLRRADLYYTFGLERAAYEFLLREFDNFRLRNDLGAMHLIVKKIISIDETNLDLTLGMAKILSYLGKNEEVRKVVENAVFYLQGQGKYKEAAEIQKEYAKLYEDR